LGALAHQASSAAQTLIEVSAALRDLATEIEKAGKDIEK